MTQEEMRMFGDAMHKFSDSYSQGAQQILQQSQSLTPYQPQPIEPYENGRATRYGRYGNQILGSDGTVCTVIGQQVICR